METRRLSYWKTPAFMALQQAWYQRLEAEGFQDAEEMIAGEMVLRQNAEHALRGGDATVVESKEAYFRLLRQRVAETRFKQESDRIIMEMAAEGAKRKAITERLNSMGIRRPPTFKAPERRCRESIRLTIRKYEKMWGIREPKAS